MPTLALLIYLCMYVCIYLFIWPRRTPCGILAPRPGIKPVPPAVEAQGPSHWTAREVPNPCFRVTLLLTPYNTPPDGISSIL